MPKSGEKANGDRVVYREDPNGDILLALIDALGHGGGAEEVAIAAASRLEEVSLQQPMLDIMTDLHQRLRGTRGAAATICTLHGYDVQACAVGNVELRCPDGHIPLVSSPGILGVRVAKFRICQATLKAAARLLLFSDGVSGRSMPDVRRLSPEDACRAIIRSHRHQHDDATVLIADVE